MRIVDPGVDHLAVARGRDRADRRFALEHENLAAGEREAARDREPDDAGADNHAFDLFHHRDPPRSARVRGRLMLNVSLKRAMRDCKSRGISWFIQHSRSFD